MKLNKENWKELDLNVDSLWLIGPRAKGGKRTNFYHGNFTPQIPSEMMQRFTEQGDTVLEMFTGSGTTLFEAETLGRNYIGFDINTEALQFVRSQMGAECPIKYFLHECDVSSDEAEVLISNDLTALGKTNVDHIVVHPPYLDIVKFTDRPEDLSGISDLNVFLSKFVEALARCYKFLKKGGHMSLVVGDIYRNGEVVPLGFYLMYAVKKHFPSLLKGIVVKDMVGNRAKIGNENLWRYRALRNGTFLFKHEYLFVFRKTR